MSLLGCFEVTNFLNEKKAMTGWHPRYRGERFSFGGFSSVVQIPNGRGKTSILSSVLGILSLDKTLRTEMKSRMAPEKTGFWSHVRVEFIEVDIHLGTQMHVALGEDLPGRRSTFGACGNSNGDVIYYYFPRELDAAPTFNILPDGARELLTNDEFRDAVKAIPGSHWDVKPFADKIKWLGFVHHHMPKNSLVRNVSHLKRGAGDKSTELFKMSAGGGMRGKPFDTRFFWQHIAPELLAGPRIRSIMKQNGDEEAEQDELYFEDSISNSGRELLAASRNVERQEQRIRKVETVLDRIRPLETVAIDAVRAEREQVEAVKSLSSVVGLFEDLISKRPLPGLLRAPETVSLDGLAADILAHMVWVPGLHGARDGQPALWSRYVMSEMAGVDEKEQPLILRRTLGENYGLESREVIENTCNIDPARPSQMRGGKAPRWLAEADIRRLIDETNRWKHPKQALRDAVREAFAEIHKLDTNPFRILCRTRHAEMEETGDNQRKFETQLGIASRDLDDLKSRMENRTENEGHYRAMLQRNFSEEDCAAPSEAGRKIQVAIGAAHDRIGVITGRRGEIKPFHDEYNARHAKEVDGWTPGHAAFVIQNIIDNAEAGAVKAAEALDVCWARLEEMEDARRLCEERRRKAEKLANDLRAKAAFGGKYAELFGQREPETGMEDILREDVSRAEAALRATVDLVKVLDGLRERADLFFKEEKDRAPRDWLSWAEDERNRLAVAIAQRDREIGEVKARLERLEMTAVAPAGDMLRAVQMIPADKEWRTVSDVIATTLDKDDDRRRMGSLFSPLLSAPVFESEADARDVRAIFDAKDFQVPVFLADGLTAFLAGTDHVSWDGDVAAGMMLGCRSDIVESIVDPDALERQKDHLRHRLSSLSDLNERDMKSAILLRSDGALAKSAEAANDFLDKGGNGALSEGRARMPEAETLVTKMRHRTSAPAFEAIRNWRDFLATGGQKELAKRGREYREERRKEEEAAKELATLREKIPGLVSARKKADAEATKSRGLSGEITILNTLQRRLDSGDFEWFAGSASQLDTVNKERRTLEDMRSGIDFGKAQQFVDSRDDVDDLPERIAKLEASIKPMRESINSLAKKKTALKAAVTGLADLEIALDNLAASTIYRYRKIQDFVETSRQMAEISPQLDDEDPLYGIIENLRDILDDPDHYLVDPNKSGFISQASTVIEEMKGRDNEEEKARTAFNKAKQALGTFQSRRIEILRNDHDEEFVMPVFEQFRSCAPAAVGPNLRKMEADLQEKKDQKVREAEDLTATREGYMQTWQYLIEDGVRSHLSYLQGILRATPDTTFELDVKVVEPEEWKHILVDILDAIEGIEQKGEEELLSRKRGAAQEEQHRADIRAQIANVLYPRLFPEARIYVRHKAIGGDGRFPFDSGVSQGEFASLELLWTVKLAEFAFKRDAIEAGSALSLTSAQRRQAEKNAQGILIIDGLFSNLSDDDLIDLSLGNCGRLQSNFQIIGFLHPPHYRNNFDIFPRMLIGKTATGLDGDGRHVWTEIVTQNRDGTIRRTEPGEMVVTTMHGRRKLSTRTVSKEAAKANLFATGEGAREGMDEHGPS